MVSDQLSRFFAEVRRRGLFAVVAVYVVTAWVALQVSATLFPAWNIPGEAIRYVWSGAILLLPVVLIFGWRYDLSATGIAKTPAADSDPLNISLARSDTWILSVLIVISLGVLFGVVQEVMNLRSADGRQSISSLPPDNSIAVLPFVNMSDDESNEYFSDGITEELLNGLARIPNLHVAARTSSFFYKGKNEHVQKIGEALGVRRILEGSVRRDGNNIRITAQLINASDGFHLWSETYDRDLDDIFAIQDEIAKAIVSMLRLELMGQDQERLERNISKSPEAYDLYLRAEEVRKTSTSAAVERSNELLRGAIDLDTEFAHAYNALAYGYLLQSFYGTLTVDDASIAAADLIERALTLRPDMEEAHASLGLMKSRLNRYDEANEHFKTAIAINGNYFGGQVNYGLNLVWQGRLKEASAAYLRAQALDPLNAGLGFNIGALMMLMGEPQNGLQFMRKSIELDPVPLRPKAAITHWLSVYGRLEESIRYGREILLTHPDYVPNIRALVQSYIYMGMMDAAGELLMATDSSLAGYEELLIANVSFLLASGDEHSFYEFAEKEYRDLDVNFGDQLDVRNTTRAMRYALSLLMQGEFQRASEFYYWIAGEEQGINSKTYDEMYVLKMLAFSYRRLGRIDESDELLAQCRGLVAKAFESGWATPTLYARLAEIYAIAGDAENAVQNLLIAFDKGWRDLGSLEYGLYWKDLQDNSGINQIKVLIIDDIAAQRIKLGDSTTARLEREKNSLMRSAKALPDAARISSRGERLGTFKAY